jgi:ribosomal protein L7/L12
MEPFTNEQAESCAEFLVRIACGIKQSSPCYWDDLDSIIAQNITNDADAKSVVDALMNVGADTHVFFRGYDPDDAAEEVAIRIIGNRGLRFNEPATVRLTVTNAGPDKIDVIKTVRTMMGLSLKEAKDIAEGRTMDALPAPRAESVKAHLENAGATVECNG